MSSFEVEFANVTYAPVSGRPILRGISLQLERGTTTALLGRSGSGKTTLMRMINGLVIPTSGSVSVAERKTSAWPLLDLRRRIGYVIQESGLFPHWTVERNAGLALELAGKSPAECRARAAEVLALTGLDPSLNGRMPWQLSGGQRQRVGFARALAGDPDILLMDEPFGALDPITRAEIQEMLRGLLERFSKTVLLVTHDLDEAMYLAERIILLEDGLVVADLPATEVKRSTNDHVRRYIAARHRGAEA